MKEVILGSGGAISNILAGVLKQYDCDIRLVSRHPKKINETDELLAGDLTDKNVVDRAVSGTSIAYLTAGLDYKYKVWRQKWPVIMQNTIDACKKYKSKLIFFDNAYMYDPEYIDNLTEETPIRPASRKGKVRAAIARNLLNETRAENMQAMIVRSSDFYGPNINTSVMMETVYKKMKSGKKPMWLGNPSAYHSMTYTKDAATATALLAHTPDCYQQIWHLPTTSQKLTGRQWIELFAKEMGRPAKFTSLSGRTIRLIGLFVPFFKEIGEMMYQMDNNYFFNCEKFKKRFPGFSITEPEEGVREVVKEGR